MDVKKHFQKKTVIVTKPVGDFLALAALGFALENRELALLAPGHSNLVHGLQAHVLA